MVDRSAPHRTSGIAMLSMVALVAGLLAPVQATATDLLQVYRMAQDNDAEFAASRSDYRAAIEAAPQARAAILPQVTLSGSYSEQSREDFVTNESDSYTSQQAALTLRQTLFDWSVFAGRDRASSRVAQAESELAAAEQSLIIRVADHYFDVLAARESVRFAQAELEAIERQLEQAQERFEVGLISITDVKEAQASHDLAISREINARNQLENAREALRTLLGQPTGELRRLSERLPLHPADPDDPEAWVESALAQNPEYLAARSASEGARASISSARAGHFPTIELVASHTRLDQDGGVQRRDDEVDSIGIELNMPLFAGGATTSQTREARSQFEASQSRMVQARRGAEQNTRNAFRGVQSSISQVRALERAVESNRAAVEATEAGFGVGTRTAVDVLTSLRDLYRAELDFAEARYDYIRNHLRLKEAAGTLTVDDLRLVNTWLARPGE